MSPATITRRLSLGLLVLTWGCGAPDGLDDLDAADGTTDPASDSEAAPTGGRSPTTKRTTVERGIRPATLHPRTMATTTTAAGAAPGSLPRTSAPPFT